jgi:hypothetical protein
MKELRAAQLLETASIAARPNARQTDDEYGYRAGKSDTPTDLARVRGNLVADARCVRSGDRA